MISKDDLNNILCAIKKLISRKANSEELPTKTSELINDSRFPKIYCVTLYEYTEENKEAYNAILRGEHPIITLTHKSSDWDEFCLYYAKKPTDNFISMYFNRSYTVLLHKNGYCESPS